MNEYTPRPWLVIDPTGLSRSVNYRTNDGKTRSICILAPVVRRRADDDRSFGARLRRRAANARLIAAAPDLFEKASDLVKYLDTRPSIDLPSGDTKLSALRDVIANMKG